jgi:hypothetical protein
LLPALPAPVVAGVDVVAGADVAAVLTEFFVVSFLSQELRLSTVATASTDSIADSFFMRRNEFVVVIKSCVHAIGINI